MNSTLFDVLTVHCFFQRWCSHKITGINPQANHDAMEDHYRTEHYEKHLTIATRGSS